MPAVVVRDERHGDVAELRFARELRLGQVGHADHVDVPRAVQVRFGAGGELRPFHADVGATLVDLRSLLASRLRHQHRGAGADRVGEGDMRDDAVAEVGVSAVARPIDELVREDDVGRRVRLFHRPDRAGGEDRVHAERLEPVDVRAVVDLGRHVAVTAAVARKERDLHAVDVAEDVRVRGVAERRRDHPLVHDVEARHVVQAGAADDADGDVCHR